MATVVIYDNTFGFKAYTVGGSHAYVYASGTITASDGLSGSLHRLADGSPAFIAGANVTITSSSNGPITIAAATSAGSGDVNATYIVLSATGSLSAERVISGGVGISLHDNGPGNALDINIVDSVVATVSGTTFTGNVLTSGNLEVSGTSLLYGKTNVGNPGFEQGTITFNSATFDAIFKVNDIAGGNDAIAVFHRHSTVDAANIVFARTKSDTTSHAAVEEDDFLSRLYFTGWASGSGGAGYVPAAYIDAVVDGPTDGGAMPGRLDFSVSPIGTSLPQLQLRINSTGVLAQNNVYASGVVTAEGGLSGSLHRLVDGSPAFIAGSNITITSSSNGPITIAASGGGGSGGDSNATYIVLSATGSLSSERVISGGVGISLHDNGAGNALDINIVDSIVATVSGTTFTGNVLTSGNLEVSGTSLLYGKTNVGNPGFELGSFTFNSASFDAIFKVNDTAGGNDAIAVFHRHSTVDAANIVFARSNSDTAAHAALVDDQVITRMYFAGWASGSGGAGYVPAAYIDAVVDGPTDGGAMPGRLDFSISPAGLPVPELALTINSTGSIFERNITVSGTARAELGFSGSLHRLADGSPAFIAGANVTITSSSNGPITIAASGGGGGGSDVDWTDNGGNLSTTSSLNVENAAYFDGPVTSSLGFSGSLHRLSDGSPAFIAGANVTITSASNGAITIAAVGGAGGSGSSCTVPRYPGWSPPSSPSAYDDELTTSGSLTGWSIWDVGSSFSRTPAVYNEKRGAALDTLFTSAMCGIYKSIPTGSFTIYGKVTLPAPIAGQSKGVGLFVSEDLDTSPSTARICTVGMQTNVDSGYDAGMRTWTDYNSPGTWVFDDIALEGTSMWFRLVYDPSNNVVSGTWSTDGIAWNIDTSTALSTTGFSITHMGFFAYNFTANVGPWQAQVQHFRLLPGSVSGWDSLPSADFESGVDTYTCQGTGGGADVDWTDNGGNLTTTSSLNVENAAYFDGPVSSSLGFSGSLHRLTDGSPAFVAGTNITITSSSNGPVTIAAGGGLTFTSIKTTTYTGSVGEIVRYQPVNELTGSGGIAFPAAPSANQQFAIKNVTSSSVSITLTGNGNSIEDPATYQLTASTSVSGDGIALTYQYDGAQWLII